MTHSDSHLLKLAECYGIEPGYTNVWGEYQETPEETLRDILRSFGHTALDGASVEKTLREFEDRRWQRMMEPVMVVPVSECPAKVSVRMPYTDEPVRLSWIVNEEGGKVHEGLFTRNGIHWKNTHTLEDGVVMGEFLWEVPVPLDLGYHLLTVVEGGRQVEMALIVTPDHCYVPEEIELGKRRVWGPAIQLYALKTRRNWGIGDFTDLRNLAGWCASHGAGAVGVNPLHELFPHQPTHISPYSPSTRAYFNTLYLDPEAIECFDECEDVRQEYESRAFQDRLLRLRDTEYVDYAEVGAIKRRVLEKLFNHFRDKHLARKTPRAEEYRKFVASGGRPLEELAVFQALHEHFCKQDMNQWAWLNWPEEYRSPNSPVVKQFAEDCADRVQFYQYLQWQADRQLHRVRKYAEKQNMLIGLYMDLAVGSDISGAQVWLSQDLFALDMDIGAPPDELNQKGQNWGLPPYNPERLRGVAYVPFINILRHNMHHAGALRLDHVMGLMRLFWIPKGKDATKGAYVRYPFDDLLGIMALESHRNKCMVIGEDLGTVPEIVQHRMAHWKILSYKVFYFERSGVGSFRKPSDYPAQALVTLSTHDLPTISGFWTSEDIRVRTELDLYPTEELRTRQIRDRVTELTGILDALKDQNLLPSGLEGYSHDALPGMSDDIALAVQEYLARTPCYLMMVQLEDILGQPKQVNLPGTVDQYPNWRRKITLDLEKWDEDFRIKSLLTVLNAIYGAGTLVRK